MINKEKLYENIGNICLMLALVCGSIPLICGCFVPLVDRLICFIVNTAFSLQDLGVIIAVIGCVLLFIVGTIFIFLSEREEEKRLEHEFRMQSELKEK